MRFGDVAKNFIMHVIFATDTAMAEEARRSHAPSSRAGLRASPTCARTRRRRSRLRRTSCTPTRRRPAAIYDELMPMFTDDGHFDPKALAVLRRSFVEMKILPAEPDMSKLYTEAFLPKELMASRPGGNNREPHTVGCLQSRCAALALSAVAARAQPPRRCASARPCRKPFRSRRSTSASARAFFKQERPRHRGNRVRAATPSCSRRWRRQPRYRHRLGAGFGLHRQRLAGQGRGRNGGPAAPARHRGAAGRTENRRRPEGQEDQRLDRGLAHLLAGERNLAPPRLGPERHRRSSRWAPWPARSPRCDAATSTA